MKKIYWLLFLVIAAKTNAQTLTQSFNEPVVGDIDKNFRLDTSAYTNGMPVNVSGNGCVWNYQNLTAIYPLVVDSFIPPSAATGATACPNTTYAQHRDNLYTFYKSTSSPQQTELLGGYSPSLTLTFTNSAIIAGYPVSYGYNLTDAVSGSFKYNSSPGVCNGSITISAAGLGTLNLQNNVSFQNVLCLKSVEILTLTTGILPLGTFNQTIYNYYSPGKKFPVLSVNYTIYQFLAGTPTITAYVYGDNNYFTVAGINQALANTESYRAFPNPFNDQLFINAGNAIEENTYTFYNSRGQLVLSTTSLPTPETSTLNTGIYILEIKNKNGTYHQKVVKE